MRIRPVPHAERRAAPRWTLLGLALAVVAVGSTAGRTLFVHRGADALAGTAVGAVVASLIVWGFPSLSARICARWTIAVTAAVMARFAPLDAAGEGIGLIALWLVGAVAILVFTDRITAMAVPAATAREHPAPAVLGSRRRAQIARTVGSTAVLAAVAVLAVVLIAPFANDRFSSPTEAGAAPVGDTGTESSPLRHSDRLDMSDRPDLTEEILLTVRSERRGFLRGEVYDRWDGSSWTRSDPERFHVVGTTVHTDEHELGSGSTIFFDQRVRIEASWADLLPAAPTAVRVESPAPVTQTLDGTLSSRPRPLGRGAVYTVSSRTRPLDEDLLRGASGPVPDAISSRHAAEPVTTDRVRELATRIVEDARADGAYDRIRALEAWMGDNLEYSIDAPPSPRGVDAVDDFLFESRLGWCEQIASSLVVMARSLGIPARLATGFVASERDRMSGDLVVRGTDAHAWAEVWFPELGWVPFDPTADVPLAPEPDTDRSILDLLRDHLGLLAAAVVVTVVVIWILLRLAPRVRSRRHRSRSPIARLERDLERLGEGRGLPRRPSETATAYASRLDAERADDHPALVDVGRLVDDHLYGASEPDPDRWRAATELLTDAAGPRPEARGTRVGGSS